MLSLEHHRDHQQQQLQGPSTSAVDAGGDDGNDENFRDIHPLASPPPPPLPLPARMRRRDAWETGSHRSSSQLSDAASSENFTSMSREFNALVLAGTAISNNNNTTTTTNNNNNHNENNNYSTHHESADPHQYGGNNLERIGEDEAPPEESNPLAIVPTEELGGVGSSSRGGELGQRVRSGGGGGIGEMSVQRVKKEEVETKINAWQNAKIAKINNRFKREDAIIGGWEGEQAQKASSWMKKVERKLEDKRARALERMQNDIAKARRKAEERRASAEAKRGVKVAKILEIANLMRAVGRAPTKRSFFK